MSPATLVRALFKRPSHGASDASAAAATRYRLDAIDAQHVARYRQALGFDGRHIPLTWYYLLAQRAHLATMLDAAFPFRLVGAIHVDNSLSAAANPPASRPLELATRVRVDPPAASGAVLAHLETQASQDGRPVFACRSSYLVVRGQRGGARPAAHPAAQDEALLATLDSWQLSHASGRAYAALSGDWNPIHLWPWSARLMGLTAPIIHGMHTLARTCAGLERAGGRPVTRLDGRFRAPIALGSAVRLAASLDEGRYTVEAGGRAAVEGRFDFDSNQSMLNA